MDSACSFLEVCFNKLHGSTAAVGKNKDSTSDPTITGRIIGVESQFKIFSFYFGVHLAELILKHTDNLSKSFQSAIEVANMASMIVITLQVIRSDKNYNAIRNFVLKAKQDIDVDMLLLNTIPW